VINGAVSFWQASLGPAPVRPGLPASRDVDVCIVGAGYTGLWTAWALAGAEPRLRIAVIEAEQAGFGASGRNGGWLSGLMPGSRERLARQSAGRPGGGRPGVAALQRHLNDTVTDVINACATEGIDADIHLGGTLAAATNAAQLARLRAGLAEDRGWGLQVEDQWELSTAEVTSRLALAGVVGGVFSPHCARIHPGKLVRGLADAVERRGVAIYERTPALAVEPGRVRTAAGDVRSRWVVLATEGFTATLPGRHRRLLPMNSSMIVTEPLPPEAWARLGWAGNETWRDAAHVYVYAQRTADGRIAIGGRGVPYRFASRLDRGGHTSPGTAVRLAASLVRLLPDAAPARVAHLWSGVLGVARDWCPAVGALRAGGAGLAWAGGYVGDGVATSHLAGRTLADLVLERQTALTALPWVGHTSRAWEPEPLRWFGVRGVYALYRAADRAESRAGAPARGSRWAQLADLVSQRP
jgi:glycine/D-amino acid oxidase-like deaminating enzyme